MATAAPSQRIPTTFHTSHVDGEQFIVALRPWRTRLFLQRIASWTGRGIFVGLVLASLLLAVARLVPWATAVHWATGVGLSCVLLAFGLAIWYRPSLARTARMMDRRLALHDRLGTAWEMRTQTAPLYNLQRRDALQQLDKHTPGRVISLRPGRRGMLCFGLLVILFALLLFLPNPMVTVLRQQAAFQARVARQVATIDRVRTQVAQQTNTPAQLRAQIDQILRDLENKLHESKNETQAQQAIAEAQAKLNALLDPQGQNKVQAQAAASLSLQGSPNANVNAVGQALATGDTKKLLQALQNLATQVSKMTPAERAKLAQQIENAANAASQNPQLQAALHQLAKSITEGNASEIADASNAVEVAAEQGANAQAQANSIDQAAQGLQQVANNLTASTDGTNAANSGQNNGQGQGQANAQGQGQGQGQNQGQGQGNGQGQKNGGSGTGGQGSGGAKGGTSGGKSGQNEQVFVPGQTGSGSSTQSNGGNNNVVQNGSAVPYSQVIKQYNLMAHDAIDNSDIAPNLKDLVHGYFDSLSGK